MNDLHAQDLDLLEEYLDGSADADAPTLRSRLLTEPELAATLDELRHDRQLRAAAFAAFEPADASLDALLSRATAQARRAHFRRLATRTVRYVAAAAACVAAGFLVASLQSPSAPSQNLAAGGPSNRPSAPAYTVALTDEAGHVLAVQPCSSVEQANDFANDLRNWQARQDDLKAGRLVKRTDEF